MRRSVLGLTVLVVGLCSGVSVAQTLKPRPPAGTQQQNEDVPASQKASENADAAPVDGADERGDWDSDQGGAGFRGAGS